MHLSRIALLWILLASCAQAQAGAAPLRPHSENITTANQKVDSPQRKSKPTPLVVHVSTTPKTKEDAANERADREERVTTDRWTIGLYIALVVAGFLQLFVFSWQIRELRSSVTASRLLIEATRREFNATHRARIEIRWLSLVTGENGRMAVKFHVVNTGETDALIIGVKGDVLLRKHPIVITNGEIFEREISGHEHLSLQETVQPPKNIPVRSGEILDFIAKPREGAVVDILAQQIVCLGEVLYWDGNTVSRRTGFCRYYIPTLARFIASEVEDYEYAD